MSDPPTNATPRRHPTPVAAVASPPYSVPRAPTPVDLVLDGNEGQAPHAELLDALSTLTPEDLRRYPNTGELTRLLALHHRVRPEEVLVTAGADDAIDRVCRAMLGPGRSLVIPSPTFEMIPRYAALAGAEVRRIPGGGFAFDRQAILDAVDDTTSLIVLISPNNPTGLTIDRDDVEAILEACPDALLLLDHAYVEFGGDDLTSDAPDHPNLVVTRTFSKARGLAGLRVGYAVACPEVIRWLKSAGNPYPVSRPALALAAHWLVEGHREVERFVDEVASERQIITEAFASRGIATTDSRGNFVLARVGDGLFWRDAMAGMGIGVRAFPGSDELAAYVRLACPGAGQDLRRVLRGIATIATPDAILFDLDGVFADVSRSYRQAVIQTAASYGQSIDEEEIRAIKARGNANNDWRVTQEILKARGVDASLDEVTSRFEALYQGTPEEPGLWTEETLLTDTAFLGALKDRGPKLGIVTGRPRNDADRFLDHFELRAYFDVLVCMEDAPIKPNPRPVTLALERLRVSTAWFIGDTPDDMRAGRGAVVLPLGIIAPGEGPEDMGHALLRAGAGRVLDHLTDILELLR